MTTRVLIAYDGTPQAERAVALAAEQFRDASFLLLTVLDPMDGFLDAFGHGTGQYDTWHEHAEQTAKRQLSDVRTTFDQDATVDVETVVGQPVRTIVEYAENNDIDHVVVGSHGRSGVSRVLLGSVAEQVVRRSPTPVTVVR